MWLSTPVGRDRTFAYVHRTEKLSGVGLVRMKERGPFQKLRAITFSESWAQGVKSLIGEDPLPFDYDSFFDVLAGHVAFRWKQKVATSTTGWAGEFIGCLAFIQEKGLSWSHLRVVRITEVGGTTTYPDFAVFDPRTSEVYLLECKATTRVMASPTASLDICAHLDERRSDGRTKFTNGAISWFEDEDQVRHQVVAFPATTCFVVAMALVDGTFSATTPAVCPQVSGGTKGCLDTCVRKDHKDKKKATPIATAAIAFYRNPIRPLTVLAPPDPKLYFFLLSNLQRGIWGNSSIVFWNAAIGLFRLLSGGAPKGRPILAIMTYIIRAAWEWVPSPPPQEAARFLMDYAQDIPVEEREMLNVLSDLRIQEVADIDQEQALKLLVVESDAKRVAFTIKVDGCLWHVMSDGKEVRGVTETMPRPNDTRAFVNVIAGVLDVLFNIRWPGPKIGSPDNAEGDDEMVETDDVFYLQGLMGEKYVTLVTSAGRFNLTRVPFDDLHRKWLFFNAA